MICWVRRVSRARQMIVDNYTWFFIVTVSLVSGVMSACGEPGTETSYPSPTGEESVTTENNNASEVSETITTPVPLSCQELDEAASEAPAAESEEDSGPTLVCTAEEGMIVTIPWQGYAVRVENLPLETEGELQSESDDFVPQRLVINFQIVMSDTSEILYDFVPPIELQVNYIEEDVANAGGNPENLIMGFWNGSRWVAFTGEKHGFTLEGDSQGGVGLATVQGWDDPWIAWGGGD